MGRRRAAASRPRAPSCGRRRAPRRAPASAPPRAGPPRPRAHRCTAPSTVTGAASTSKNTKTSEPSSSSTMHPHVDLRQARRRERRSPRRPPAGCRRSRWPTAAKRGRRSRSSRDREAAEPDRVTADVGLDEVHRRRADERGDEDVLGLVVELLRGVDLLHLTVAHDGNPLAERHRLDLVVRDVDGRRAESLVQLLERRAHADAQLSRRGSRAARPSGTRPARARSRVPSPRAAADRRRAGRAAGSGARRGRAASRPSRTRSSRSFFGVLRTFRP